MKHRLSLAVLTALILAACANAYAEAWNKAPGGAGKAAFHLFDDGFHGFRKGSRAAAKWPELLTSFDAGK